MQQGSISRDQARTCNSPVAFPARLVTNRGKWSLIFLSLPGSVFRQNIHRRWIYSERKWKGTAHVARIMGILACRNSFVFFSSNLLLVDGKQSFIFVSRVCKVSSSNGIFFQIEKWNKKKRVRANRLRLTRLKGGAKQENYWDRVGNRFEMKESFRVRRKERERERKLKEIRDRCSC